MKDDKSSNGLKIGERDERGRFFMGPSPEKGHELMFLTPTDGTVTWSAAKAFNAHLPTEREAVCISEVLMGNQDLFNKIAGTGPDAQELTIWTKTDDSGDSKAAVAVRLRDSAKTAGTKDSARLRAFTLGN